jgi:glutamate/tyrosine decarboxylase-like PLP-dependent enzyme
MYKMNHGPFAIPPRPDRRSTTKRCLETARSFLKSIRAVERWGRGHKRLLQTTADKKAAKHIRAHDGLKLVQNSILSTVCAWPRDEGQPANRLAKLVGRMTTIVREITTTQVRPKVNGQDIVSMML